MHLHSSNTSKKFKTLLVSVQGASTRLRGNKPAIEMSTKQTEVAIDTEELKCFTSNQSPPQCSFLSNKNVKQQILHTPNARNYNSQYEETLDIMEPHFESFSVPHLSDFE